MAPWLSAIRSRLGAGFAPQAVTRAGPRGPSIWPEGGEGQALALQSAQAPAGYRGQQVANSVMSGSSVLLIEDALPWGTTANEALLQANGMAFDVIPSAALASTDLTRYQKVIVASDQPTATYGQLALRAAQIDQYVNGGGVLEFHAAGWGWQSGNASLVTLPGGMGIQYGPAAFNDVLDPAHPLMAGVPDPFTGNSASHSYFTAIPAGAARLAADDQGRVNLVVYPFGRGLVIAGGQTFEWGYANGQGAGIILRNMIPYRFARVPQWLTAAPDRGGSGQAGRCR